MSTRSSSRSASSRDPESTPTIASARKAKRPIVAILKYLTMVNDEILDAFPPGKVPDPEKTTLRTKEEMAPYLLEPFAPGWKSVYEIPMRGPFTKL